MGHSAFDFGTAMFKALAVILFAAAIMVVVDADTGVEESKWYLVETYGGMPVQPEPEPEPTTPEPTTPEPTTTPCPYVDGSSSCNVLADHCDKEGISTLCGKTCKCDKGAGIYNKWYK